MHLSIYPPPNVVSFLCDERKLNGIKQLIPLTSESYPEVFEEAKILCKKFPKDQPVYFFLSSDHHITVEAWPEVNSVILNPKLVRASDSLELATVIAHELGHLDPARTKTYENKELFRKTFLSFIRDFGTQNKDPQNFQKAALIAFKILKRSLKQLEKDADDHIIPLLQDRYKPEEICDAFIRMRVKARVLEMGYDPEIELGDIDGFFKWVDRGRPRHYHPLEGERVHRMKIQAEAAETKFGR